VTRESKPAARTLLTHFLKTRRAALRPGDVGLPPGPSYRRTTGLRRCEVAQLAGISTEWYTLFEMGRDRAMTQRVIGPVAQALRLTEVEREYVNDLVRAEPPPQPTIELPPALGRLFEDDEKLVIAYDRWLNATRWNAVASVATSLDAADTRTRNVLWRLFHLANARERYPQWESRARFFVGLFRRALGRDSANPEAHAIVRSLESSRAFVEMWDRHEVFSLDDEARTLIQSPLQLRDPRIGEINYFTVGLQIPASAGGHVRIAVPSDDDSRTILRVHAASLEPRRSA